MNNSATVAGLYCGNDASVYAIIPSCTQSLEKVVAVAEYLGTTLTMAPEIDSRKVLRLVTVEELSLQKMQNFRCCNYILSKI